MVYDNTNRGAMWLNTDKSSERHPDLKGSLNVNGKEYWVSGWGKKEHAKPMSPEVTFQIEEKRVIRPVDAAIEAPVENGIDDDLPF